MIRRQAPKIVVIDAESDPDSQFEGLGNLVRKIRNDFDVEVEFMSLDAVDKLAKTSNFVCPKWLRALDSIYSNDSGKAYAALTRVVYQNGGNTSWLLYINASLTCTEPRDILHPHDMNSSFPQQATAD